ncbi:hypothetical protein [Dongia sp.]|uniref:hypothetical protein n=1 Tax=Dongia sp. TaxID=1977262 RepID=UPI003752FA1F
MTKHDQKPHPAQPNTKPATDGVLADETLDRVNGGTACETLSNVSKTRSEISMTFARNARG